MKFNCDGCGLCCKKVKSVIENNPKFSNPKSIFYFPYGYDENGVCENSLDNKCKVYDNRPLICNVERFADELKIDKETFFKQNESYCQELKREATN